MHVREAADTLNGDDRLAPLQARPLPRRARIDVYNLHTDGTPRKVGQLEAAARRACRRLAGVSHLEYNDARGAARRVEPPLQAINPSINLLELLVPESKAREGLPYILKPERMPSFFAPAVLKRTRAVAHLYADLRAAQRVDVMRHAPVHVFGRSEAQEDAAQTIVDLKEPLPICRGDGGLVLF